MNIMAKFNLGLIVLILLCIAMPMSASADDGDTPPVTQEVTEVPPETEVPPVNESEEVAPETESIDESEVTESGTVPETEGAETPQAEVAELLAEVPDGTDVIVLDENGEPEPLVTQDAAVAILAGDPIWCPVNYLPTPGKNGCTISYANLTDLLTNIGDPDADGTIWIQSGAINDANLVLIDGNHYSNWQSHSLSLQGGWSGDSGDITIGANSIFSVPIVITNWNNNVVVNNLTIQDTDGTGLWVDTKGNIALSNVSVSGNDGDGAYLDNTSGTGTVTVTGTANNFSNNGGVGLGIHSKGSISLMNMTANNNDWGGAFLQNCDWGYFPDYEMDWCRGTFTSSVTLAGINTFNGNGNPGTGGSGLVILSDGDVALSNLTASNNIAGYDAVDDSFIPADGVSVSTYGAISVTGTNVFNGNEGGGLTIIGYDGHGDIYLENVEAIDNYGNGAYVYAMGTRDITIAGVNSFSLNSWRVHNHGYAGLDDGLFVLTQSGDIQAENISSTNEGGIHLQTDNGSIALTGTNTFTSYSMNIFTEATGDILLEGITSTSADMSGLRALTQGNITVNNSTFQNNADYGLEAGYIDGPGSPYNSYPASVTLNDVTFSGNGLGPCLIVGNGTVTSNLFHECERISVQESEDENNGKVSSADVMTSLPSSSLPVQIIALIDLAAGDPVNLECDRFSGTTLQMENGSLVTFYCPTLGEVTLVDLQEDDSKLPDGLPEDVSFLSALSATLRSDDISQNLSTGKVVISFAIPAGVKVEDLSILYWNEGEWIDLAEASFEDGKIVYVSGQENPPGFFTAETNFPGVFVLATK